MLMAKTQIFAIGHGFDQSMSNAGDLRNVLRVSISFSRFKKGHGAGRALAGQRDHLRFGRRSRSRQREKDGTDDNGPHVALLADPALIVEH
jgi:hypothetical protein